MIANLSWILSLNDCLCVRVCCCVCLLLPVMVHACCTDSENPATDVFRSVYPVYIEFPLPVEAPSHFVFADSNYVRRTFIVREILFTPSFFLELSLSIRCEAVALTARVLCVTEPYWSSSFFLEFVKFNSANTGYKRFEYFLLLRTVYVFVEMWSTIELFICRPTYTFTTAIT